MELNHQIRLCRPFPFLFGFRAIFSKPSCPPSGWALKFAIQNLAEQGIQRHIILQKNYCP